MQALNEVGLRHLIDAFYARVRADAELEPIFNDAMQFMIGRKLAAIWPSVIPTSGRDLEAAGRGASSRRHHGFTSELTGIRALAKTAPYPEHADEIGMVT